MSSVNVASCDKATNALQFVDPNTTGVPLTNGFNQVSRGVVMANGNTVVLTKTCNQGGAPITCNTSGRVYDNNLKSVGGAFPVETNDQVVATSTGFAVIYAEGGYIRLHHYRADGSPNGGVVNISATNTSSLPSVTQLKDGRILVAWIDNNQTIKARVLLANTNPNSAVFDVSTATTTLSVLTAPAITGLTDGGFAVAWKSGGNSVVVRAYDNVAAAKIDATVINTALAPASIADNAPLSITSLNIDKFVVVWHSDTDRNVFGRTLSNDGVPDQAAQFLVSENTSVTPNSAESVIGLPNGGFIISWQSQQPINGFNNPIMGRSYSYNQVSYTAQEFVIFATSVNSNELTPMFMAPLDVDGFVVSTTLPTTFGTDYLIKSFATSASTRGKVLYPEEAPQGTDPAIRRAAGFINSGSRPLVLFHEETFATHSVSLGEKLRCRLLTSTCIDAQPSGGYETVLNKDVYAFDQRAVMMGSYDFPLTSVTPNSVAVWQSDSTGVGEGFLTIRGRFNNGDEFQVNQLSNGYQRSPVVAMLDEENYIVVWESLNQDGSGWGVVGRVYYRDGPLNDEFIINDYTNSNQERPRVAASPQKDKYFVAWRSLIQDGDGYGVYGKFLKPDGESDSAEIQIAQITANNQQDPSVTFLADGSVAVAWTHMTDGDGWGLQTRVFPANGGTPTDARWVNTVTLGDEQSSAITALPNGGYVVVWQASNQGAYGNTIVARLFDQQGYPVTPELLVNAYAYGLRGSPTVVPYGEKGGFAVAWDSWDQDGNGGGVYGRLFDEVGDAITSEFLINTITAGDQFRPALAAVADVNGPNKDAHLLLASWESYGVDQAPNSFGIAQRPFSCSRYLIPSTTPSATMSTSPSSSISISAQPSSTTSITPSEVSPSPTSSFTPVPSSIAAKASSEASSGASLDLSPVGAAPSNDQQTIPPSNNPAQPPPAPITIQPTVIKKIIRPKPQGPQPKAKEGSHKSSAFRVSFSPEVAVYSLMLVFVLAKVVYDLFGWFMSLPSAVSQRKAQRQRSKSSVCDSRITHLLDEIEHEYKKVLALGNRVDRWHVYQLEDLKEDLMTDLESEDHTDLDNLYRLYKDRLEDVIEDWHNAEQGHSARAMSSRPEAVCKHQTGLPAGLPLHPHTLLDSFDGVYRIATK